MPRVSVGLPVFNGGKYLRRAIESTLDQTLADLELIISDNASTDETEATCREFARLDPRVRYYRNDANVGASRNYTIIFEHARAPYFKWLAADDALEPTFLERCVDLLDGRPELVFVCSRYLVVDELNGIASHLDNDYDFTQPRPHQRWRSLFREPTGHEHPNWGVGRTNVIGETGLLRPYVGSDSAYVVELLLKGPMAQVPEHLHHMRIHEDAYSTKLRSENAGRDGMQGPAEAKWLDPRSSDANLMPHWRLLREYVRFIRDARESRTEKLRLAATLVHPLATGWRVILVKELAFRVGLGWLYVAARNLYRRFVPREDGRPSRPAET